MIYQSPELVMPCDLNKQTFNKFFKFNIQSRDDWKLNPPVPTGISYLWYSDGSCCELNRSRFSQDNIAISLPSRKFITAFQLEIEQEYTWMLYWNLWIKLSQSSSLHRRGHRDISGNEKVGPPLAFTQLKTAENCISIRKNHSKYLLSTRNMKRLTDILTGHC